MAKQTINIGSNANDGTGDPLRTAFDKINDNFTELYGSDNDLNTLDANLDVNNFIITTGVTNGSITISPNGTGDLLLGALRVNGTSISADNSTFINLNEGVIIDGSLRVDDAVNLNTSLTLAAGATITEFSTSTSLGTSNTLVPTQNAVKAYVDAQNVSQAITFVGDDSTGTAVNSGETFQILGGTGLTSVVTGDAITLDIDATVVTLTGGQTLTNKALTSPTISGTPTIIGVTASGATGTGNLVFSAGPTLTGTLAAATITASGTLSVTGNTAISGSLTTSDITTTGNHSVTGNITAQGTVFSDKIKSPATNANLEIAAQGTGIVDIQSAMTTIGQTITGTASVTGQLNADNIRIDGNTISSTDTNGDVIITPNGGGQITLSSSRVGANQLNAVTVAVSNTVDTNTLRSFSSNADIVIQPQGTGTVDFKVPAQGTVGSAGAASALPATPTGYFTIKVNGSTFVVPYYAQS
jgi:cytoskeletal protein CcmA (bactofilin family)